jgi:hypothetical protein
MATRDDLQKVARCQVPFTISAPGSAEPLTKYHTAMIIGVERGVVKVRFDDSSMVRKLRFSEVELLPEDASRLEEERFLNDRRRKHHRNGLSLVRTPEEQRDPEPEPEVEIECREVPLPPAPAENRQKSAFDTWLEMGRTDVLQPLEDKIRRLAARRIELMQQQDELNRQMRQCDEDAASAQREYDVVATALDRLQC